MSDIPKLETHTAKKTSSGGQGVYGWALVACIAVAGLFIASVFTGRFDGAFDQLRSGLASIGTESKVESAENETPQSATTEPNNNQEPAAVIEAPSFDIVRVEPTGEAVMAGLSFPNDQIEIVSSEVVIATAKANASGEWALVLEQALQPGGYALSIRTTSSSNDVQIASEEQVTISVPNAPTESAIVMLDSADKPSSVWQSPANIIRPDVAIKSDDMLVYDQIKEPDVKSESSSPNQDGEGERPKTNQLGDIPDPLVTIETVEIETDGTLYALGASNPSALVRVYFDEKLVGQTETDASGRWRLATQHLLPKETYTVRVDQVDTNSGNVLTRRSVRFGEGLNILLSAPVVSQSTVEAKIRLDIQTAEGSASAEVDADVGMTEAVVVNRGDSLWSISRRLLGRGIRYTTLYDANEDQIGDPSEVFPGQVFVVPNTEPSAVQN
ncbi:MAG: LysM peptidoglycan-binding domain-containing protein [Hyphomicrobiales bacterium]